LIYSIDKSVVGIATRYGLNHKRNLDGARGTAANAPPILMLCNNSFWLLTGRGENKKYKHFLNDCLGGVKAEKN